MEKMEVSAGGYQKIVEHIDGLQEKTATGIIDQSSAARIIKEIRSDLFALLKVIRSECVIINDAAGPEGPNAA